MLFFPLGRKSLKQNERILKLIRRKYMKKTGDNEFTCEKDERIWIRFTGFPERNNVNIRQSWDAGHLQPVSGDFISFKMETTKRQLTLEFDFVIQGSCSIELEGENGGGIFKNKAVDTGDITLKIYTFLP
jgi:hypothetical protein